MNLQTEQQFFASTLKDYLEKPYAIGIWFKIGNISANSIRMYIQGGVLLDENRDKFILHTECRIPEKKLYELLERFIENPHKNIVEAVQNSKDYRKGIEALIQTYPQLKYATLNMSPDEIMDYLYIGDRPAHQAVTYILHLPNIDTTFLRDMLAMNFKLTDEEWVHPMRTDMQQLQQLFKNPPSVHSKFGAQRFYFYEKGKLGFATVHPDRTVKWFGEELSGLAQGHINRVATSANIIHLDRPFFNNQALGRVYIPSADKETGKFRNIYIQKYDDGTRTTDVFMENAMPLKDWNPEKLISMKGRLTQVQFMEREDGHYVRCRIDGEQQMYKHVNPDDYTSYQKGIFDAEHLAAKYFVRDFLSMQEERSQGMKR